MHKHKILTFLSLFLILSLSTLDALAAQRLIKKMPDGAIGGEKIIIKASAALGNIEIVDTQTGDRFTVEPTRLNRSARKAEYQLPFSRRDTNRLDILVNDEKISRFFTLVNNNDILPEENLEVAFAAFGDEVFNGIPVIPSIEITIIAEDDDDNANSTGGGGGRGAKGEDGDSFFSFDEADQLVSNREGSTFLFQDLTSLDDAHFAYYAEKNALVAVRTSGAAAPAGLNSVGENSTALGLDTTATGDNSFATGNSASASGDNSFAAGNSASASANNSFAAGNFASAAGGDSVAMGLRTEANAAGTTAVGSLAAALANFATAVGSQSLANGTFSLAIGGDTAFAEGDHSIAVANNSNAFGANSTVLAGPNANTTANADSSVVIGNNISSDASNAFVIGSGSSVNDLLTNDIANSLNIGFNSDIPTLHIGGANGAGTVGNVGIGVTNPGRKLVIGGNNPAMRIQPRNNAPNNPRLGDFYVDSSGAICVSADGATFTRIAGAGTCN